MIFNKILKIKFLFYSIICIALGNSWIMPMVLIQPYLYAEYLLPWMLGLLPILYKSSGMVQILFSRFSLYTNSILLIILDIISLINIVIFLFLNNGLMFLIIYILEGYLQCVIGEQWSNQFKDYVSKKYSRYNKKFLDVKSFYTSLISILISFIVLAISFYVSKTDYRLVIYTVIIFNIIALIYQFWYTFIELKNELKKNIYY